MPKKHARKVHYHKDIRKRRLRKALRDRLHRLSLREISFRTCEADPEQEDEHCLLSSPPSHSKIIKRTHLLNFAQSLEAPLSVHCVFSLYGMITIDESALQTRTKDQSLIKSLFHFHSLAEVQANPDYLLLRLRKNRDNPYPIPYIVARFKSHGDSYLHQMACKIEQIHLTFQHLSLPHPPTITDKLLQKYLQQKRGKRFMLRASPNCLIFSKELLEMGGFGVEEMALECLSYRCLVSDIFLADDYRGQIDKFFELYEKGKALRSGQLKQEEYLKCSQQQEVQYFATNQQTLLTVLTEKTNLMPGLGCWEVKQVINQQQIAPKTKSWALQANDFQKRISLRQAPTLSKLTKLGKNLSNFNKELVCSYTTLSSP